MGTKKKVYAGIATCLVLGIGATTLMGMTAPEEEQAEGEDGVSQVTIVETASPHIDSIVVTSTLVGTVEPGQQVMVYPKVSGEVTVANYAVGDTVQAGALLFQVDSTSTQLQIAQQQAAINSRQAASDLQMEQLEHEIDNYNYDLMEGYNQAVVSAENTVVSMETSLQVANANLRAARSSYNDARSNDSDDSTMTSLRNSITQMELAVEQAQINLEQAQNALELAIRQVEETVESNDFAVRSAELSADITTEQLTLQQLQNTLSDHTVSAPIGGVIEQKNLDVYDMASTQSVAYIISNKDAASVSFKVSESALLHVGIGDTVTIDKDEELCVGTISEISTMVDASSGLYEVKATVTDAPFEMRSGSIVKVIVATQKAENELMLPIDAVYYDDGDAYVYLFDNNTARRVEIETGITDDNYIHVKSGVSLTDDVIVTWSASLTDGAEVYLPGTAPASGAAAEEADEAADEAAEGADNEDPDSGEDTAAIGAEEAGEDGDAASREDSEDEQE